MALSQPFYAVRVVIHVQGGDTFTRDYVRGEQKIGIERFGKWALGDMIAIVSDGILPITWEVVAIDFATVQENRRYQHTTHAE